MPTATIDRRPAQITMPGIAPKRPARRALSSASVSPGQPVAYHGRIRGGPRFGMTGTIVETRARKAVVDMGAFGKWHIPYYLLSIPPATKGESSVLRVA